MRPTVRSPRCTLPVAAAANLFLVALSCAPPPGADDRAITRTTQALGAHQLSGVVFGGDDPLPDVTVEALANGTVDVVATSITSAAGQYQLALEAGTYDLRVTPPPTSDFVGTVIDDVAMPDSDAQHNVVLVTGPTTVTLTGRVTGYQDGPLADALVQLSGQSGHLAYADADGRYRHVVPSGDYTLHVSYGYSLPSGLGGTSVQLYRRGLPLTADTTHDVALALVRVRGTVKDPGGNPVAGALLHGQTERHDGTTDILTIASLTTDELGYYEGYFLPGVPVDFEVAPPPGSPFGKLIRHDQPVADGDILDLTLPPASVLEGVVTGPAGGGPVAGLRMRLSQPGVGSFAETDTDENGRYRFLVPDGTYDLAVGGSFEGTSFNYLRPGEVVAGDTTLDITLSLVRIEGTVTDASGAARTDAMVFAWSDIFPGQSSNSQSTTDASGQYALWVLPGNSVMFGVDLPPETGYPILRLDRRPVTEAGTIDLQLPAVRTLSGTVRGRGGVPLPRASVSVRTTSNFTHINHAASDAQGRYSMLVYDGFYYNVDVTRSGEDTDTDAPRYFRFMHYLGQVTADISQDLDLPPTIRVRGRVLDSNGVPIPGVPVTTEFYSPPTTSSDVRFTDASGGYDTLVFQVPIGSDTRFRVEPDPATGFNGVSLAGLSYENDFEQTMILDRPDDRPPTIVAGPSVAHQSDTSVTLTWTTDEPSDSTVEYGTGGVLDGSVTRPELVTVHFVTLTNLTPATTYNFRVRSTDASGHSVEADGNPTDTNPPPEQSLARLRLGPLAAAPVTLTAAPALTFSTQPVPGDVTPPSFTRAPAVVFRDRTSAVIAWETDEPASSRVEHGLTTALGSTLDGPAGLYLRAHSLRITGLTPSTSYFARVSSKDPDGNGPAVSATISFTTTAVPDTTAPRILTGPTATVLGADRIVVNWTTDEAATGGVSYNNGIRYDLVSDDTLTTDHQVVLAALTAGQSYTITVSSRDAAGNGPTLSAAITATTATEADALAPTLGTPTAGGITQTSALVSWTSSEAATSELGYGLTASASDGTLADTTLTTQHELLITGLKPGTTYHVRARSTDGSGNVGAAPVITLRTLFPDSDGDGVPDDRDRCPAEPAGTPDADGDGCPDGTRASIADLALTEGASGSKNADLKVTLSRPSPRPVVLRYATADGTARAGSDYDAASGLVTFPPGVVTQTVKVAIRGDGTYEADETFFVNLTVALGGATLQDGQAQVTITNDEAKPTLSLNDVSVVEGNSGQKQVALTVTVSRPSNLPIRFSYTTRNGTAQAPADYIATSGVISFVTLTKVTLNVTVKGDKTKEPNETLTMVLGDVVNATLARGTGTLTISNDDK